MERSQKIIVMVALLRAVAERYHDLTGRGIRDAQIEFRERRDGVEVRVHGHGTFELHAHVTLYPSEGSGSTGTALCVTMYHAPEAHSAQFPHTWHHTWVSKEEIAEEAAHWPEDRS